MLTQIHSARPIRTICKAAVLSRNCFQLVQQKQMAKSLFPLCFQSLDRLFSILGHFLFFPKSIQLFLGQSRDWGKDGGQRIRCSLVHVIHPPSLAIPDPLSWPAPPPLFWTIPCKLIFCLFTATQAFPGKSLAFSENGTARDFTFHGVEGGGQHSLFPSHSFPFTAE